MLQVTTMILSGNEWEDPNNLQAHLQDMARDGWNARCTVTIGSNPSKLIVVLYRETSSELITSSLSQNNPKETFLETNVRSMEKITIQITEEELLGKNMTP